MKQRKLVVDRIWVQHGLFRSSNERHSQKTGSYTVTASLVRFQWLLRYIISLPHKTGKGNALPRHNSKRGPKKRSYVINIFILLKALTLLLTCNKYMVKNLKFNFHSLFIAIVSVSMCLNKAKLDSVPHSVTT